MHLQERLVQSDDGRGTVVKQTSRRKTSARDRRETDAAIIWPVPDIPTSSAPWRVHIWMGSIALAAATAVSVWAAWGHVVELGQDLQWSPAVLFLEGINPYAQYLAGNPDGRLILEQYPNYAHALYVLLTPLALLSFEQARLIWAVLNQIASVYLAWSLGRSAGLSARATVVLVLAFLCSTPFRTGLANGQMATFTMLAANAIMRLPSPGASLVVGLSYIKYSFAPPTAAWVWQRHGTAAFLWSVLPCTVGYLVFLLHVGGAPIDVLTQPLAVSATAAYSGGSDLMALIHMTLNEPSEGALLWPEYAVPLVLSLVAGVQIARRVASPVWALALLSVTSLLCFRHLVYDQIALLPAAACAGSRLHRTHGRVVLGLVAFQWYGIKMLHALVDYRPPEHVEVPIQLALGLVMWRALWAGAQSPAAQEPDILRA